MTLVKKRPLTPSQRFQIVNEQDLQENAPEKRLTKFIMRSKGRNSYGRITSRRRGGGHKKLYRFIDFKRNKYEIKGKVASLEYDPFRSANIALVVYADGEKRYIIAPNGVVVGSSILSTQNPVEAFLPGTNLYLKHILPATFIHAVELNPGKGAQIARGAGAAAQLMAIDGDKATLKMPSGEVRYVSANCRATIGVVGNSDHQNEQLGKAGRNRWKGRRPRVRGVAMNPIDHPMGGGEGRTSGGGHPVSPWGQLSKGLATRRRSKPSNRSILIRCNGRKMRKG